MTDSMAGRSALITGAASGIARETALQLAARGVAVAVADRDLAGAGDTVASIEAGGGRAAAFEVDVADSARVNAMAAAAEGALGPIEYLVNLAGIYQVADVEEIGDEDWARMLAVHVNGTFYVCRAVLPGMMARRSGAIVNVTSLHALRGQAHAAHYAAAKGAILSFTKSLAREKAPCNIRVNAVAPGPIDTPLWRGNVSPGSVEAAMAERSKAIPLGRLGQAREIAPLIVFLLSPEASYMTGGVVTIDGGELMPS